MPLPVNSPATTVWDFLAEATSGTAARSPVPNRRSPAYIRWVQSSLNRVMKAGLTADGRFGPRTRQALRAFQQQKGLVAGGVVGPATERALVAAGAPAFSAGGNTVPASSAPARLSRQPTTAGTAPAAVDLAALASAATKPTAANVVAIMRAICRMHNIPFALGLTVLDHECDGPLAQGFRHPDGLMQTTRPARASTIPRIPRPLAKLLLELPPGAPVDDAELNRRLHAEFSRRVAVQIATGVQELAEGLRVCSGYVALALIAYNAGQGNAAYIATQGKAQRRPAGSDAATWETMCRLGSAILQQAPKAVNVEPGRWRCDMNIPAWYREFRVRDRPTGLLLISYQYLRSVPACIREQKPTDACTAANHKERRDGSGPMKCQPTRAGVLDKLYEPRRLRRALYDAAAGALPAIVQDSRPLKIEAGQFVKMPLASQAVP